MQLVEIQKASGKQLLQEPVAAAVQGDRHCGLSSVCRWQLWRRSIYGARRTHKEPAKRAQMLLRVGGCCPTERALVSPQALTPPCRDSDGQACASGLPRRRGAALRLRGTRQAHMSTRGPRKAGSAGYISATKESDGSQAQGRYCSGVRAGAGRPAPHGAARHGPAPVPRGAAGSGRAAPAASASSASMGEDSS